MPKRRERVAAPPASGGCAFRFATNDAVKGGGNRSGLRRVPGPPGSASRPTRDGATPGQHPLKGSLDSRTVNGVSMEQWQYEVSAGGRVWYCIDDDRRTVWMTDASVGHPKAIE
jgi:hypothetical protein